MPTLAHALQIAAILMIRTWRQMSLRSDSKTSVNVGGRDHPSNKYSQLTNMKAPRLLPSCLSNNSPNAVCGILRLLQASVDGPCCV